MGIPIGLAKMAGRLRSGRFRNRPGNKTPTFNFPLSKVIEYSLIYVESLPKTASGWQQLQRREEKKKKKEARALQSAIRRRDKCLRIEAASQKRADTYRRKHPARFRFVNFDANGKRTLGPWITG